MVPMPYPRRSIHRAELVVTLRVTLTGDFPRISAHISGLGGPYGRSGELERTVADPRGQQKQAIPETAKPPPEVRIPPSPSEF